MLLDLCKKKKVYFKLNLSNQGKPKTSKAKFQAEWVKLLMNGVFIINVSFERLCWNFVLFCVGKTKYTNSFCNSLVISCLTLQSCFNLLMLIQMMKIRLRIQIKKCFLSANVSGVLFFIWRNTTLNINF